MKAKMTKAYLMAMEKASDAINSERGDTNFISIIIILGIVIVVAGVFLIFKDKIVQMVEGIVNGFTIK